MSPRSAENEGHTVFEDGLHNLRLMTSLAVPYDVPVDGTGSQCEASPANR